MVHFRLAITNRRAEQAENLARRNAVLGKGRMGSALMGSLEIASCLTGGLFGYSR